MPTLAGLIGGLGFPELLLIFAIFFLIFGAGKLPQLGRGLGEGIRNFKKGLKTDEPSEQLPARTESQQER
ncbi:MAG TPA: twin-arginine translocase TatA/TatE family subunit [Thermoanaerobaculia bacterium]|nr:twin-arginine translocase TatA/TatE family subunit [Thermoanaerobaculia bacterium]